MALADAIDVLSAGIDNVNESLRPELVGLRASVLEELGLAQEAIADILQRAQKLPPSQRARYEVMAARIYLGPNATERKKLKRALPHAVQATELDPTYFEAWRLRAEIYGRLHRTEFAEIETLLLRAHACEGGRENNWVLYELAVTQFYLEEYEKSSRTFNSLRRVSRGNTGGMSVLESAGDRTGDDPYEYEGRVLRRATDGMAAIHCQELSAFGEIWFNPRRQKQYDPRVHDRVSFLLGMNYRGLQAIELRKL